MSDPGSSVPWTPPEHPPDPMELAAALLAPLDEGVATALEQARELGERQPFHVTDEDREMAAAWSHWVVPEHLGTDLQRLSDTARGFIAGYRAGKSAARERNQ